jgi:acetyl esterase/lipase
MMDPASHRHVTSRLAKETGGRVLSVRYRLAPQNPFPAALLDALVCYLSLLNPPTGSPHSAIPASKIVFAGDSAGGNLATVLLQLILQLHRDNSSPTVAFNGVSVSIPLPGAIALNSPWMDVTRAMPSIESNAKFDYLPPVSDEAYNKIPPCSIWPATPPRTDLYCDGSALCHPLVSPLAAMDWKGSPPVFFGYGEEMLSDEGAVVMQRMARQGVSVVWEQYEAMPHCFALILDRVKGSDMCFDSWAKFCKDVVEGKTIASQGTFITAKKLERKEVDVTKLVDLKDEEVLKMMSDIKEKRIKLMEKNPTSALPKL